MSRLKIGRVALLDQVHEVLKERILDRVYAPGEHLNIDALARELAVSSTPIREALGRLTAEGLVQAAPFVGFSVAPMPTLQYYRDLFAFREVIEPWAAAEAARRRNPENLAELDAALKMMVRQPLDPGYGGHRAFIKADEAFHLAVMAGTGNEPALKSFADLRAHGGMSRLYIHQEQDPVMVHGQHLRIVMAIRAGEPEAAAERMREHLQWSRRQLLD